MEEDLIERWHPYQFRKVESELGIAQLQLVLFLFQPTTQTDKQVKVKIKQNVNKAYSELYSEV